MEMNEANPKVNNVRNKGPEMMREAMEAIEGKVRQHGRDGSALWRPFLGRIQNLLFHVSRLQPLPQDGPVHRDVSQQSVVADIVEAAPYIAFQHPRRRVATSKSHEGFSHRIRAAAFLAKSIRNFASATRVADSICRAISRSCSRGSGPWRAGKR